MAASWKGSGSIEFHVLNGHDRPCSFIEPMPRLTKRKKKTKANAGQHGQGQFRLSVTSGCDLWATGQLANPPFAQ
jgi:hypothetical protein